MLLPTCHHNCMYSVINTDTVTAHSKIIPSYKKKSLWRLLVPIQRAKEQSSKFSALCFCRRCSCWALRNGCLRLCLVGSITSDLLNSGVRVEWRGCQNYSLTLGPVSEWKQLRNSKIGCVQKRKFRCFAVVICGYKRTKKCILAHTPLYCASNNGMLAPIC